MKQIFCICLLFIAANASAQWQPLDGPDGGHAQDFAAADGQVFAAVGKTCYVSADKGEHWIPTITFPFYPGMIAVGVWFALNYQGIFRSLDDGVSWEIIFQSASSIYDISWSGTALYGTAKSTQQIFYTPDLGASWVFRDVPDLEIYPYFNENVDLATQGDSILLTTSGGCAHGGVTNYLSYDKGLHWRKFLPPDQQWDIELPDLPAAVYLAVLKPENSTSRNKYLSVKWVKM